MGKYLLLFIFIIISSCNSHSPNYQITHPSNENPPTVMLQSLGNFSNATLHFLQDSIPKFYPVKIIITPLKQFPANAYYAPRNRYRADTIINWLKKIKPGDVMLVIGLTNADISTTKGKEKDYGVMGLGFQPGVACVISEFRLQNDHPSEHLLQRRLFKTVVHEMGHNFGLPHCPNKHCIMADAEGKMNQDNETGLCNDCRKMLKL